MATFRVEKNKSYTVMSNHHLRNNKLSLKAKGLLSQMLSLPEEWDYTLSGLAAINKESKDAIRSAVVELEQAGYIQRRQTTDADGKFAGNEYIIHEEPLSVSPLSDFPTTGNPSPGNPTEINKEGIILGKNSNDGSDDDPFDPMPLFVEWIKKVSSSDWNSEEKDSLYLHFLLSPRIQKPFPPNLPASRMLQAFPNAHSRHRVTTSSSAPR